jgi:hypothetical protein
VHDHVNVHVDVHVIVDVVGFLFVYEIGPLWGPRLGLIRDRRKTQLSPSTEGLDTRRVATGHQRMSNTVTRTIATDDHVHVHDHVNVHVDVHVIVDVVGF